MSDTTKEPTGLELLQHVLRGCKYQDCYVSIISDEHAKRTKDAILLSAYNLEHSLFVDVEGEFWQYVVPIDNQGKVLTADDVGFKCE